MIRKIKRVSVCIEYSDDSGNIELAWEGGVISLVFEQTRPVEQVHEHEGAVMVRFKPSGVDTFSMRLTRKEVEP